MESFDIFVWWKVRFGLVLGFCWGMVELIVTQSCAKKSQRSRKGFWVGSYCYPRQGQLARG